MINLDALGYMLPKYQNLIKYSSLIIICVCGFLFTFILGEKALFASNNEQIIQRVNIPTTLQIPKIGITANIESHERGENGEMKVPVHENNVSWWSEGAGPGQYGSFVIAGHIDREKGGPGVFYDLSKLQTGDEIVVRDIYGKRYIYIVKDIKEYATNDFPLDLVFSQSDSKRLNLITCAGQFSQTDNTYDKRLVVFSELK